MNRLQGLLCVLTAGIFIIPQSASTAGAAAPYAKALKEIEQVESSPYVQSLKAGRSSAGRRIPAYIISDLAANPKEQVRIFIGAGQHGDEYGAVKSVISLSKELASGANRHLLSGCTFIVVPMINPDGVAKSQRLNAQGMDVNRDWLDLQTPEAKYVDEIIKVWKPQAMIDAHEWTDTPPVPGDEIEVAKCISDDQSAAMQKVASDAARSSGLALLDCTAEANSHLFHRRYALKGYGAFLIETAWGADYATKNRTYSQAILSIAGSLVDDAELKYLISPTAHNFNLQEASATIDHSRERASAASTTLAFILMLSWMALTGWLLKKANLAMADKWSHQFRKCSVDCDVEIHPFMRKRRLQSFAAKVWVRRRLRPRYAEKRRSAAVQDKSKHIPEWPIPSTPAYGWALMDEIDTSPCSTIRRRIQ